MRGSTKNIFVSKWVNLNYELHITVSILKNQIASLQEEIENMKIQTPKMSIKDIINDTEKVSYINGVMDI